MGSLWILFWREIFSQETFWREMFWREIFWREIFWREIFWREMFWRKIFWREIFWREIFWCSLFNPFSRSVLFWDIHSENCHLIFNHRHLRCVCFILFLTLSAAGQIFFGHNWLYYFADWSILHLINIIYFLKWAKNYDFLSVIGTAT